MKTKLLEYLNSHRIMSLATYGENPWICWVFYIVDEEFNLYFVSSPESQHIKDLDNSNEVACAITDTMQNPLGELKGVQMWGKVTEVKGTEKLKTFFKMWKKVINTNEKKITYDNYAKKTISSRVYKIAPKKFKWFNKELENTEFCIDF